MLERRGHPVPYGDTFVDEACNTTAAVAGVRETGGWHGESASLDGVFDMSGNVAEWEDACMVDPFDSTKTSCLLRGGSFQPGGYPPPQTGPFDFAAVATICGVTLGDQHFGMSLDATGIGRPTTGSRRCADDEAPRPTPSATGRGSRSREGAHERRAVQRMRSPRGSQGDVGSGTRAAPRRRSRRSPA
jgi:hypothetical protein